MAKAVAFRSQNCEQGNHSECDGWGVTSIGGELRQERCACACRHRLSPERRRGLARNRELLRQHLNNRELSTAENHRRYLNDDRRYVDTYDHGDLGDRLGWARPEDDVPDPETYSEPPRESAYWAGLL